MIRDLWSIVLFFFFPKVKFWDYYLRYSVKDDEINIIIVNTMQFIT